MEYASNDSDDSSGLQAGFREAPKAISLIGRIGNVISNVRLKRSLKRDRDVNSTE